MNSSQHSVLIVDSNEAFATMLKQSLEETGSYRATLTTSGDQALQAIGRASFDLAVVDVGLTDTDAGDLARTLRERQADLRLILIPLMGEDLSPEMAELDVQGVLPKPFFLPELPDRIAEAMRKPMGGEGAEIAAAPAPEPAPAPKPTAVAAPGLPVESGERRLALLREHLEEVIREMKLLSQEINAEAVILASGEKLLAHTGRLSVEEADRLAQVANESWRTSARVAKILGQEQLRFEQSVEGGEHMFYSLAVAEDVILSAALRARVPLGMIRHRAKATADALQALMTG